MKEFDRFILQIFYDSDIKSVTLLPKLTNISLAAIKVNLRRFSLKNDYKETLQNLIPIATMNTKYFC